MCDADKIEYPSAYVAANAATLHQLAVPECTAIRYYPCGDHFHIGHKHTAAGDACKAAHPFGIGHHPRRRA